MEQTRKALEGEIESTKEDIAILETSKEVFMDVINAVNELKNKILELVGKAVSWVLGKLADLVQIPPEYRFWEKIFKGVLNTFITGEIELPDPDPASIVKWLWDYTVQPIIDLATATVKPPLKMAQELIDYINSITAHPRSITWSFSFWGDMSPEMLKSDAVKDMVPAPLKPTVEKAIQIAEKADKENEAAKDAAKKIT